MQSDDRTTQIRRIKEEMTCTSDIYIPGNYFCYLRSLNIRYFKAFTQVILVLSNFTLTQVISFTPAADLRVLRGRGRKCKMAPAAGGGAPAGRKS